MNIFSWIQLVLYMVVLISLSWPLGAFMARVYQGKRTFLDPLLRPM
jgi:K+-transporting ATPase ATPase A chain